MNWGIFLILIILFIVSLILVGRQIYYKSIRRTMYGKLSGNFLFVFSLNFLIIGLILLFSFKVSHRISLQKYEYLSTHEYIVNIDYECDQMNNRLIRHKTMSHHWFIGCFYSKKLAQLDYLIVEE